MCRDLWLARCRTLVFGAAALCYVGVVYAFPTTPATTAAAQAQADGPSTNQLPIDHTALLRSWQFVRGNPIYSAFELSEQDGEREFYEWSAGLFAGQGHWRWLDANRIEISANNGSSNILEIKSVSADTLILQLEGSSELSYFVPLVQGAASGN